MPLNKDELDSFYQFATERLSDEDVGLSIEECFFRWRFQRAKKAVDLSPFPNGETLRDRLIASGVLGGGSTDHPEDLSTNPDHMEGFGE